MLRSDISLASAFLLPSDSSRKEITDEVENYQQGLIPPALSMGMSSVEKHSIWLYNHKPGGYRSVHVLVAPNYLNKQFHSA